MPAPMPPLTMGSLAGAIADVVRASAVWGAESTQREPDQRTYAMVVQYVAQLGALICQRELNDDELGMIFQQLGAAPPN